MSDAEIACTLSSGDRPQRVEDWNALTARAVSRTAIADGVRLDFGADGPVDELIRLAAAEQSCCSFFSFAVTIDGRGIGLEVRAPEAAADMVVALFSGS